MSIAPHTSPSLAEPPGVVAAQDLCPAELVAWRGLLRVHASLLKQLDAELEAEHGLPLTSYEVLMHLADAPEHRMRMCDLADSVLLSRSGMSRLVDRLERDGLLCRAACTNDARGASSYSRSRKEPTTLSTRPSQFPAAVRVSRPGW